MIIPQLLGQQLWGAPPHKTCAGPALSGAGALAPWFIQYISVYELPLI